MRMQPIVDGIEQGFSDRVRVVSYNARDGAQGQALFESLALAGHPSVVILSPDGREQFRGFGEQTREFLLAVLAPYIDTP